jgi:hypothetical protein
MEEKNISINVDGKLFTFEKNTEILAADLLKMAGTSEEKSYFIFKHNIQLEKYERIDNKENIKLKDGMVFKTMPKEITNGNN